MCGVRAMLAGVVWAAAMATAGAGIPMYREWDTAVRFDGMESGEIGVDEEMRRELRAGPIREGIMGKELVVDLTGGGGSGVKVVGAGATPWRGEAANSGTRREDEKKKEDDGWLLSAIRQADGSSGSQTSLGAWLVGGGEEKDGGWGWLAGGVKADAEGRMAEAVAAMKEESQDWGAGDGTEGGGKDRMETEKSEGLVDIGVAPKSEEMDLMGEMSRTREALEMAGMKTDDWKSTEGERRFAAEGIGVDWKSLTAGTGMATWGSDAVAGKDIQADLATEKSLESSRNFGEFGGTEGNDQGGNTGGEGDGRGWGMGSGNAGMAGAGGLGTGIGTGTLGRERWGGGWVLGKEAGRSSGFGFRGLDGMASGMDGAGSGWGAGAGSGVSGGTSGRSGGAAWEAWQKRGENSGGGFTPVWR